MGSKTVIIINGRGGAGKDTLCESAGRVYRTVNVSSITPIKELAMAYGWKGEKDERSRRFLADLKRVFVAYNDLPTKYLLEQYELFLKSEAEILFAHIREGEEIDKFKRQLRTPCYTLLIRRTPEGNRQWGNASDDEVECYSYDFYYDNDKPLPQSQEEFLACLKSIIES